MNDADLPNQWDTEALKQGAAVCIMLAVPFRVLASLVGGDSGGLNALFFLLYLAFFIIGAGCAAWVQRTGTPITHAIATAVGTAVFVEFVFVIVRLVRGTTIQWFAIGITMSLILLCGALGGVLGSRLQAAGWKPSSQR